ncbi:MAG: trypsin-like peptidase domain-containing protein [Salinibacter sp.]|uniref:trypsin-like peptidase domain-containing protein n=1 Tax=Salinibacter sp. TaxID=2065818 RepID=UPI0035D40529
MSTKGKLSVAALVGGALLAGILFATASASLLGAGDSIVTSGEAAVLKGSTAIAQDTTSSPGALQTAFTKVAESVNPAVVQIRSQKKVEREVPNPFEGTPFERFFGRPGPSQPDIRRGLGSGVVVRPNGYIVTNNHVVQDADQLSVRTLDGTEYDAEVVGTDQFSDLAVLRIDASGLPSVSFGDSDQLDVGQWVLAFGSPLSRRLNNSVTAGIVSALGRLRAPRNPRNPASSRGVNNFIQTDAAINPGNSGGPLVNLKGELVGINTAIASQTGGYQGIGFAIPANTVKRVVTQLIEQGDVRRAYLGIRYQPASRDLIKNENLPDGSVIIRTVAEGSAAEEAGLQSGDVITHVGGQPLEQSLQIANLIASKSPGDEVSLRVFRVRSGEKEKLTVTLGSRDEGLTASRSDGGPSSDQLMEELGLSLQNVTPEIARQLGLDAAKGVVITDVDPSNPFIRGSGLEPQQVILRMAGEKIPNMEAFRQTYSKIEPGQAFRLVIRSPEGFMTQTSLRKPEG